MHIFNRLRSSRFVPCPDAPLIYTRVLPAGVAGLRTTGRASIVEVETDLTVRVRSVATDRIIAEGEYAHGDVYWFDEPSADFPRTAQDIVAADVADMMRLFQRRLIEPAQWTSHPRALAYL